MSRDEFLRGLEEALSGEVPAAVIRDNVSYYGSYISQEMGKGRTMEEIVAEIGEPRIVARTIIDSCEAAGETGGAGEYRETAYEDSSRRQDPYEQRPGTDGSGPKIHYFDLSKWYWKLLLVVILVLAGMLVFTILGGVFALLVRFAGPILMICLIYWIVKNLR